VYGAEGATFIRNARKKKENSKLTCSNCKLEDGENPPPSNYRGCKSAKELQKKETQLPQAKEKRAG